MTLSSTARLMTPEEIAVRAGEQIDFLHLPEPGVFAERALRLRQLAPGHAMQDFLGFAAALAQAQHEQLRALPGLALPSPEAIELAASEGRPVLDARTWPRDPAWRDGLRALMRALATSLPAGPAQATVQQVLAADGTWLEQQADRLLHGILLGLDLACGPLVAAGLQLYWTALVQQLQTARGGERLAPFGRIDDPTACPCCGSPPLASLTRLGAEAQGFRYLCCSLCATQWHYVRIKCSRCQSTKGISLRQLLSQDEKPAAKTGAAAVQAECCEACGHYLKIMHMEHELAVEPCADDLATLSLDLLLAESGLQRHGQNLWLLFGDPDGPPPDESPGSP